MDTKTAMDLMDILGWTLTGVFSRKGETRRVIFGDITKISYDGYWLYTISTKDRETGEVNSIRLSRGKLYLLKKRWIYGLWNPILGYCVSITITNRYYEHREANARKKAERLEQERLEQERLEREGEV